MKVQNEGYPPNTKYFSLRRLFVESFHTQATLETPGYGLRPATQQYADQGRSRIPRVQSGIDASKSNKSSFRWLFEKRCCSFTATWRNNPIGRPFFFQMGWNHQLVMRWKMQKNDVWYMPKLFTLWTLSSSLVANNCRWYGSTPEKGRGFPSKDIIGKRFKDRFRKRQGTFCTGIPWRCLRGILVGSKMLMSWFVVGFCTLTN